MIVLDHLAKQYRQVPVFSSLSYTFADTGFYLLFGPSGCGKTTLLNMIAGIITPDQGSVYLKDKNGIITDRKMIDQAIAYLPQDSIFVEYLTIEQHISLLSFDPKRTASYFERFSLTQVLKQYPGSLSGGEKQRVSLIFGLLQNKQVILLDEPTASLDQASKILVFSMLKELRNEVLILCVSHDQVAKAYCDIVIDFRHLDQLKQPPIAEAHWAISTLQNRKQSLMPFVKYFQRREHHWRRSDFVFLWVLVLSFLLVGFSIDPQKKITSELLNQDHVNYLQVEIPTNATSYQEVEAYSGVSEMILDVPSYTSVLDRKDAQMDGAYTSKYFMFMQTLPAQEFFPYWDYVSTGSYFTQADQMMLGSDFRSTLKFNPELSSIASLRDQDVVGKRVVLDTVIGPQTFVIAGIFNEFDEHQKQYFYTLNDDVNQGVFLHRDFAKKVASQGIEEPRQRYTVYFDRVDALLRFQTQYSDDINLNDEQQIYAYPINRYIDQRVASMQSLAIVLLPVFIVSCLISLIFYLQSVGLSVKTNQRLLSAYQYFGFDMKSIRIAYQRQIMMKLIRLMVIACLLDGLLSVALNGLNRLLRVFSYTPLQFSMIALFYLLLVLSLLGWLIILWMFRRYRKLQWYSSIRQERDLL